VGEDSGAEEIIIFPLLVIIWQILVNPQKTKIFVPV
jgi:hypothetical protein